MIFAGILWGKNGKNLETQYLLKKVFSSLSKDSLEHYENNFMSLWLVHKGYNQVISCENILCLGRAFNKKDNAPLTKKDLVLSQTKNSYTFSTENWGGYLYFQYDSILKKTSVLREPTGQLDFFYFALPGGDILFSSKIFLIFDILSLPISYNWDSINFYLAYGGNSIKQIPFSDIFELPPGYNLTYNGDILSMDISWNPLASASKILSDVSLAEILCSSLAVWTDPYKDLVLFLSGGLDSTSLLYCLKNNLQQGQTLRIFNHYSSFSKSSNETEHAKRLSQELGVEFITHDWFHDLPFSDITPLKTKPNRITTTLFSTSYHKNLFERLHINQETSLVLSGAGGDFIFMGIPPIPSIVDCFFEKGFSATLDKMSQLAIFYRIPFYSVLKAALVSIYPYLGYFKFEKLRKKEIEKSLFIRENYPPWLKEKIEITEERKLAHPFIYSKNIFPGKALHMQFVIDAVSTIYPDTHLYKECYCYPLLFQPFIEAAFSIPSYNLYTADYDRYPLRAAMSKYFRTSHVWRKDKGCNTGAMQAAFKYNLKNIMTMCLDGILADNKVIDKDILKRYILDISAGKNEKIVPLLYTISTEIFLQAWKK
ncbi:MAG: hypothetical protein JSS34_04860 [Proteobacteria bacterium]|nr:hypothetical protein [Pseudomonadota bacterium]